MTSPRLSASRRRLAAKHWPRAMRVASWFARRYPEIHADWEGAAAVGLCRAAAGYRRGAGASFASYAWAGARMACLDAIRAEVARGFTGVQHAQVSVVLGTLAAPIAAEDEVLTLADQVASGDLPVGWEAESEDAVEALCRLLPNSRATVVRDYYLHGRDLRAIGRRLGVTGSAAVHRHREALRALHGVILEKEAI